MNRQNSLLRWACCAGLMAACCVVTQPYAQIWGPLTLDELKLETQRRADRNQPPIAGIKPDDARAAVAQLTRLDPSVAGQRDAPALH